MTRAALFLLSIVTTVTIASRAIDAHKPVTSKYTYNEDVYPIVLDKCANCHRSGGIAPMSLVTYEDAVPWAESIRVELIAGHMPPAAADPSFGAVQPNRYLTARETDILLTWATGGSPRGTGSPTRLPPAGTDDAWPLGTPDLVLKLPETVTLPADRSEDTREFTIAPKTSARWIRGIDVHPGTAAIVHNVSVLVKGGESPSGNGLSPETVLARWIPGQVPTDLSTHGAAFLLPAGAELVARVHYKKTWQYDGKPVSDDTAIGLYFTKTAAPRQVFTLPLDSPSPVVPGATASYGVNISQPVDALNLRVDSVPADMIVEVQGVEPNRKTIALVRFPGTPNWERRYWFSVPVRVAGGSRIQVKAIYRDPALVADAFGGVNTSVSAPMPTRLRLSLDVIAADTPGTSQAR